MPFYNQRHKFYCTINLHAKKMYVCSIDQKGKTKVHENINTDPELLFDVISQIADPVAHALYLSTKNGSKENQNSDL